MMTMGQHEPLHDLFEEDSREYTNAGACTSESACVNRYVTNSRIGISLGWRQNSSLGMMPDLTSLRLVLELGAVYPQFQNSLKQLKWEKTCQWGFVREYL